MSCMLTFFGQKYREMLGSSLFLSVQHSFLFLSIFLLLNSDYFLKKRSFLNLSCISIAGYCRETFFFLMIQFIINELCVCSQELKEKKQTEEAENGDGDTAANGKTVSHSPPLLQWLQIIKAPLTDI